MGKFFSAFSTASAKSGDQSGNFTIGGSNHEENKDIYRQLHYSIVSLS